MRNFILLLILLHASACWPAKSAPVFHVIVDPGHGGSDMGAVRGKYRESDITLLVAKELVKIMEAHPGYRVSITRTRDEKMTPPERTKFARSLKANLFLSIHVNSSLDEKIHGAEFYFKNQLPPEEETLFLANSENQTDTETVMEESPQKPNGSLNAILDDLRSSYDLVMSRTLAEQLKNRWQNDHNIANVHIRQGPFQVLLNVQMPSLLVELGFISNPREASWLNQPQTHKQLAQSIFSGVQELKEKMDKYRESSHIATHAN